MPISPFPRTAPPRHGWRCSAAYRPCPSTPPPCRPEQVSQAAVNELLKRGVVEPGDWVILTKGDSYHTIGCTNTMKILHVGEQLV